MSQSPPEAPAPTTPQEVGRQVQLVVGDPLIAMAEEARANIDIPLDLGGLDGPQVLVWDYGRRCWRGLILPAGTHWVLVGADQVKPKLWTPDQGVAPRTQ